MMLLFPLAQLGPSSRLRWHLMKEEVGQECLPSPLAAWTQPEILTPLLYILHFILFFSVLSCLRSSLKESQFFSVWL